MQTLLALVISIILVFLFWFLGHVAKKELKVTEDQNLLSNLINIALGAASFLIILNLIGTIIKDFNIGLYIALGSCIATMGWQLKEFKQVLANLKQFFVKDNLQNFFKQNTDKYFWILFGVINLIYGLTAFSSTKLDRFGSGNSHVFNINTLLTGNYPPKYSFAPSIAQKYHYGSDILGAIISKCSGAHPEVSLDILLLVFLNLSLLALYALAIKFLNTNPVNKYLVPFGAFLAWGPITNLFTKNPGETVPTKFLEKIQYLTQTRLIDSAAWSGSVLHWFFAPPVGLGIFFFLIALYLLFRFFEGERNLRFTLLLGAFLSSLVIIDFSKFVILLFGMLVYLFFSPIPLIDDLNSSDSKEWKEKLKAIGILLLVTIVLGFVHGNWLRVGKDYASLITYFNLGTSTIDKKFGPFNTNIALLALYGFGFYKAYKLKQNWVFFTLPFFIVSYVIAFFIAVPDAGVGKIMLAGNLIAAFSLPLSIDFLREKAIEQFKLDEKKIKIFYGLVFFILGFSSLMFFAFGDKERSVLRLDGNSLKYVGYQTFPATEELPSLDPNSEEYPFVQYLKAHNVKDQTIVAEHHYAELFSKYTSLNNLLSINDINILDFPVRKEILPQGEENFRRSFFLDKDFWKEHNIKWLYLTPLIVKAIMPPQVRTRLLNAYLNGGVKLVVSNNKDVNDPSGLKELYEINPDLLDQDPPNKAELITKLFSEENKEPIPGFIKQIAECPYFAIYNAKSNDFDGDKISDIAFFDQKGKKWFIIYGKDQREEEIDLSKTILANYNGTDLLIPIPSDYDGDGKTDVALFNKINATWLILRSSDSSKEPTRTACSDREEIPIPADLDGDSKCDYSCFNMRDSRWPALLSATNYSYISKSFGGKSTDIAISSNIDDDKKSDYIIYGVQNGNTSIYLSSKEYNPTQIQTRTINTNVIFVPGDYDGNGKVDIAFWTPPTNTLEVKFTDNPIARNTTLDTRSGIPIPLDINGDGKDEITIYDSTTGQLEILYPDGVRKKVDLSKYINYLPANFIGI